MEKFRGLYKIEMTEFKTICDRLCKLYEAKNADYDGSFHKTYLEEGLVTSRIRLSDKLNRFKKLSRLMEDGGEHKVLDESIIDTLIDLACYSIMTIIELEKVGFWKGGVSD